MRVEPITRDGAQMFRVHLAGGVIRTLTAIEVLTLLHAAIEGEQARRAQLQRDEAVAQAAVREAVRLGNSATAARADVTRAQADIVGTDKEAARLEALADEVCEIAIEAHAAPLRQQFNDDLAAALASLPQIPTLGDFHA
jgi:hypothetical protein